MIEKAIAWPLVAPLAAGVAQVGALPVVAVRTCPVVPAAVATGTAPAPPPYTTPYCVSKADEASVPDAVYARTPPEVPEAKFVPPLATGRMPVTPETKLTVGFASVTAAPAPAPSVTIIAFVPVAIVTVAPEP